MLVACTYILKRLIVSIFAFLRNQSLISIKAKQQHLSMADKGDMLKHLLGLVKLQRTSNCISQFALFVNDLVME